MTTMEKEIKGLIQEETRRRGAKVATKNDSDFVAYLEKECKQVNRPINLSEVLA